jgi:hypothetical protein
MVRGAAERLARALAELVAEQMAGYDEVTAS